MAKLYVFGIGGTGARIIKSLTMLLSTGVKTDFDIVPILIDPDGAGGDLNRTIQILREYQSVHNSLVGYEKNDFFANRISTLGEIVSERGQKTQQAYNGFRFELNGVQNDRFKDFIGYQSLDQNNRYLTQMLFSEENLEADLKVGFKGNPNIGSVVLNQFTTSEFFQAFCESFQPDDRIFIASSIFGGTGAAGFPLLLKNLRKGRFNDNNYAHLQDAKIGAITVLPYFKVKKSDESEIESHGFISKTKAALNYYSKNITGGNVINALYYIGDKAENTYENNEGGTSQQNDAHFIELASALAIVDFCKMDENSLQCENGSALNPIYKEFGTKATDQITFHHLYDGSKFVLNESLTRYFYFDLFLKNALQNSLHHPFATEKTTPIDKNFLNQSFYKSVTTFNRSFRIWLAEIDRNSVSFSPFSFTTITNNQNEITGYNVNTKSIFTLVKGCVEKKNKFNPFAQNNFELFVSHLNKASDQIGDAPDIMKRFMGVFSKATATIIAKKLF